MNLTPKSTEPFVRTKPPGYSSHSKVPYYTERFGLQLKKPLDDMIADPNIEQTFNCRKLKTRQMTLYNKVYHAWRWLIDNLDGPDSVYSNLKKETSIRRYPGEIRISRIKYGATDLTGDAVTAEQLEEEQHGKAEAAVKRNTWKDELVSFIEEAPEGEIFERVVRLTEEDMIWLSEYLEGVSSIIAPIRITTHKIKLSKNAALAAALKKEGAA